MAETVRRDDVLVITLHDGHVKSARWRSPDGKIHSVLNKVRVKTDHPNGCPHCREDVGEATTCPDCGRLV